MLGGGSNVLVSDGGIRGLVVRPRGGRAVEIAPGHVRADAALTINGLVRWTISHGMGGLEAWAGTPGTVGGGVYGNAHWGGHLLSERIHSVWLWSAGASVAEIAASDMSFGYDASRLQTSGEVLIAARFVLDPGGDPDALRATARTSLAYRKRTQPLDTPSAGCIFQNPSPEVSMPSGIPRSAGALVDRAGLKGARIGGAVVSHDARQFHRERGWRDGRRHPGARREMPHDRARAIRRRASRRDRPARRTRKGAIEQMTNDD